MLRSLADAFLGQRRTATLKSLEPYVDRTAAREKQQREHKEAVARGMAQFHAIVEEKARKLAAEMVAGE